MHRDTGAESIDDIAWAFHADAPEWIANGFETAEDAQLWRRYHFPALSARYWRERQFDALSAAVWVYCGFSEPLDAEVWRNFEFIPLDAAEWGSRGVYPRWAREYADLGFTVDEAMPWLEADVPAAAARHLAALGADAGTVNGLIRQEGRRFPGLIGHWVGDKDAARELSAIVAGAPPDAPCPACLRRPAR